jgi:hypothetical protein
MGQIKPYKILVENPYGKGTLGRLRCNGNMILK